MSGRERLTAAGYSAAWRATRLVPEGVARAAFTAAADRITRRGGRGVWQLGRNLSRVVDPATDPDRLAELVRDGMRSYARYWREAFRLPDVPVERMRATFHMHTPELFELGASRGAVLALSHSANWEHAGVWVTAQGHPLVSVAERLRPESMFRRFVTYREQLGMRIVPNRGGARPPLDVLRERLDDGAFVALLADRDLSARGVPVTFFGHPTRMPAGPALLALQTGRPLFAVELWYGDDGTHARMVGPLTPRVDGPLTDRAADLTQRVADELAAGIARHPTDWHMLQRLWLDDGPGAPAATGAQRATAG